MKNKPLFEDKLRQSHVLIVTHVFATGPAQDLETFLVPRVASLFFIGHPFPYAIDRRSFWRSYQQGKCVAEGVFTSWHGPELGYYVKDLCLTLFWVWRYGRHFDLAICADSLNTFAGLLLRLVGRIHTIVFYCIDWIPQRFKNPFLNRIYHWLDWLAVCQANRTWNLSPRMQEARALRYGDMPRQMTVPIGIWLKRFPLFQSHTPGQTLVYFGHLRPGQGLPFLLEAFTLILKKEPKTRLSLIGGGEMEKILRNQAEKLGIISAVTFHGFISSHEQAELLLLQADVAVAPYEPGTFTYYTDPGKVKVYLAAGLPTVITEVPAIAREMATSGAGKVVPYDASAFATAVLDILREPNRQVQMAKHARVMAEKYDWDYIFPRALEQTLMESVYLNRHHDKIS